MVNGLLIPSPTSSCSVLAIIDQAASQSRKMPPKKASSTVAAAIKPARTTRASASVSATKAAASPGTTAKANGKKRAAADEVDATPPSKPRKTNKAAATAAADEDAEEDAAEANEREILASLSDVSAGADSSDEEAQDDDEDPGANSSDQDDEDDRLTTTQPRSSLASLKLPNSKDDAVVRARLDKLRASKSKTASSTNTPGVLYIGRLPKGFFEKQLKSYFTQFGQVTRLRVSRNKKTGASKHYAFVEFADQDVARIVQETMHNYLIDGRLLQVKEVSKDKVHPELWVGANRKFRQVPGDRIERVVRSREKTEEEQERSNERKLKRQEQRRQKLAQLGINYDFEGYTKENGDKAAFPATTKKTAAKSKAAKA